MFECRACLLRSLRAVAGDALSITPLNTSRRPILQTSRLAAPPVRRAASTSIATRDAAPDTGVQDTGGDTFDEAGEKGQKKLAIRDDKALRVELQYLSDPLKLAEHVRYTLRCYKPEKALNLCRLASKQQQVTVSWNHCVDWHMSQGKIQDAIKIYNEMKKRAQFPDSYTYVLLLRGLARPLRHGEVVKRANVVRALSIYNSMSSPTSRVKPSIYHTNAALQVCSTALDMDSLWSIAAKLPSTGKGAPDYMTYSIILNAIRHGAVGDNPIGAQLEHIASRRQEAVNQGRRIWQEIIPKWRAGEIHIDEQLVCAMGRLLLISKRVQDWDDVFNLVQQTMNIERQIAPLGSIDRHTEHVPQEMQALDTTEESAEDADGYRDAPSTRAFHPVQPLPPDRKEPVRPATLAYVRPGNPTLSMLIGACTVLRTPKTANAYWDLLTSRDGRYSLTADLENFHAQFRLLGVNRSSARAVQVLRTLPRNLAPKNMTFRIVMSTCARDKNNHNCLDHARAVVDEMDKHLPLPDVHTLLQYLNLALSTNDGPKIASALDRLDSNVRDLRSHISRDAESGKQSARAARSNSETIAFFQAIIGAFDDLTSRKLVPEEDFEKWQSRRSDLTKFIGRARERNDAQQSAANADDGDGLGTKMGSGAKLQRYKTADALKKIRWQEKAARREEAGRQRDEEMRNWDVGMSRSSRHPRRFGDQKQMFGDSPMDLAVR